MIGNWRRRTSSQQQRQRQLLIIDKDRNNENDYYNNNNNNNNNNDDNNNTDWNNEPKTPRITMSENDMRFAINDWRRFGVIHLFACALFNIITLGVYGVLQEKIMTIPYESKDVDKYPEAVFSSSIFLVFSNRVWALCVSFIALMYTKQARDSFWSRKWWFPHAELKNYAFVAFSNIVSTLCQYEVLKYLSYAISTLAKAAKILPTMVWGYFLHGRRFSNRQYLSAVFVTAGCFVFVFNSSLAAKNRVVKNYEDGIMDDLHDENLSSKAFKLILADNTDDVYSKAVAEDAIWKEVGEISAFQQTIAWFRHIARHSLAIGALIMLIYLTADGFTSSFQQRMFRVQKTPLFDQMFWTCVFGTLFSAIWVVSSGQLKYVMVFLSRYPDIKMDIFYLSISSALSQISITYTIRAFGAVTLATVLTIRQVFSISLNAFLFHEPLAGSQWIGLVLILLPLFLGINNADIVSSSLEASATSLQSFAAKNDLTHHHQAEEEEEERDVNNSNSNNKNKVLVTEEGEEGEEEAEAVIISSISNRKSNNDVV